MHSVRTESQSLHGALFFRTGALFFLLSLMSHRQAADAWCVGTYALKEQLNNLYSLLTLGERFPLKGNSSDRQ